MGMEVGRLEIIVEAEAKKASAELDKLIGKLTQVGTAMKGATGLKLNGASGVSSTTNSLSKYTSATSKAINGTRSLTAQISRLAFAFYSIKRIIGGIGKSIKSSMDFTETVNLFQTSFKKIGMEEAESMGMEWGSSSADAFAKGYIERAQNFNNLLTDSLGLDPNTMMNYQAVFAQMSNSMGLVTDSAMNISESFTMLGNDIASLWNIDTKSAMQKLQSGLAGQIRPLRQLGIDISQTSLQMTAHNHGIDDSVIKMSQAAKVQLRWLSVMEQAEVAFGDMAKTIDSPANQLRILKQQWDLLSRSIGNVFLPVIQTILPFVNAVVIALRNMINTLATAMGYELPDYKDSNIYTDATTDIEGMTDGIEDATKANEKLKKSMYSGDELNILSDGKGSGSGGVDSGSGYDVLDDAIADKNASYLRKFNEEMGKMSDKAKELSEKIGKFFEPIGDFFSKIDWETIGKDLSIVWDYVEPYTKSLGDVGVAFLDTLGKAINTLVTAVDAFMTSDQGKALMDFLTDFTALNLEDTTIWLEKVGVAFDALTEFINNPNAKNAGTLMSSILDAGKANPLLPMNILDNITQALTGMDYGDTAKAVWTGLGKKLKDTSISNLNNVIEFVIKIPQTVATIQKLWDDRAIVWKSLKSAFAITIGSFVSDIATKWGELAREWKAKQVSFNIFVSTLSSAIAKKWGELAGQWRAKTVDFAVRLVTTIGDIKKFVKALIDAVNTEIIAKLQVKIGGFTISAPKIPYPPGYADGGYPTPGQLFVANEPGNPELIGNVGGRTAVMNNNQIVEAVSQGVAVAVASVMGGQSSGGQIIHSILKLGEDVVYEAYESAKRSNGMRFNPTTA